MHSRETVAVLYAVVSSRMVRQPVLDAKGLRVFTGTAAAFLLLATPFLVSGPLITLIWCAAPVLLSAGDKVAGKGRLYPSPVSYDLVRDGLRDLVIGDLWGHLTVAPQRRDGTFAAEQKVKDVEGKVLDFGNW